MKKRLNYLDVIPYRNPKIDWRVLENNHVELDKVNKGLFYFLSQKIFRKPRISKIEMEEIGSFIWQHMDGTKTVYDISGELHDEFGEKAEPLIDRLVKYLHVLASHKFILYKK